MDTNIVDNLLPFKEDIAVLTYASDIDHKEKDYIYHLLDTNQWDELYNWFNILDEEYTEAIWVNGDWTKYVPSQAAEIASTALFQFLTYNKIDYARANFHRLNNL